MSDFSEIHDKINHVASDLAYLIGKCDQAFPMLCTKDEMRVEIANHRANCKAARANAVTDPPLPRNDWKLWTQIGTGIGALLATLWAVLEVVKG